MYAEGLRLQRQGAAVAGSQRRATGQQEGLGEHRLGVVVYRAGLAARDQVAGAVVGAVGERLEPQLDAVGRAQRARRGIVAGAHQHQRQGAVVGRQCAQHGGEDRRVAHHVLVQRAVRLDVAYPFALGAAESVEGADLVEQQVFHFLRRAGQRAPAEADQVGVAGVRADAHAMLHRQGHGAAHGAGIAGVEAAGDVGAIDQRHHLGVQAHAPGTEALADIAVQQQAVHAGSFRSLLAGPHHSARL